MRFKTGDRVIFVEPFLNTETDWEVGKEYTIGQIARGCTEGTDTIYVSGVKNMAYSRRFVLAPASALKRLMNEIASSL